MKKFKFNLDSVLDYRERIEENEKNILTTQNIELRTLNEKLSKIKIKYHAEILEFEKKMQCGIKMQDAKTCQVMIKSIELSIENFIKQIIKQENVIKKQTQVVIKASQDTKTIDKLKEKNIKIYEEKNTKDQEKFIEEFVSYQKTVETK